MMDPEIKATIDAVDVRLKSLEARATVEDEVEGFLKRNWKTIAIVIGGAVAGAAGGKYDAIWHRLLGILG